MRLDIVGADEALMDYLKEGRGGLLLLCGFFLKELLFEAGCPVFLLINNSN